MQTNRITVVTNDQVGGEHYSDNAVQPIDYIIANNLDFSQGNVVKYITRFRDKNNGYQDLKKAIQYIEFIMKSEYRAEFDAEIPF